MSPPTPTSPAWRRDPRLIGGIVLLILGSHWQLIGRYGTFVPYWDAWNSVGAALLQPWSEGRLSWRDFLAPANEHRIVLTRLLSLALVKLHGQWDAGLETVVNGLLKAGWGLMWFAFVRRQLPDRRGLAALAVPVALTVSPLGWENTVWGPQSQIYLVAMLSLAYLWIVLDAPRAGGRWAVGALCGGLALAAMSVSVIAPLAVIATLVLRAVGPPPWRRVDTVNAVLALALAAAAAGLLPRGGGGPDLHPDSLVAAVKGILLMTAWPATGLMPWGLVLTLPIGLCAWHLCRHRLDTQVPFTAAFWGTIFWFLGFILATTWSRGAGGNGGLASRYAEFLTVGPTLSVIALWALPARSRPLRRGLLAVWYAGFILGLGIWIAHAVGTALPAFAAQRDQRFGLMQRYLTSGDRQVLADRDFTAIAFSSGTLLADRLDAMARADVLPGVLQPLRGEQPSSGSMADLATPPWPDHDLPLLGFTARDDGTGWIAGPFPPRSGATLRCFTPRPADHESLRIVLRSDSNPAVGPGALPATTVSWQPVDANWARADIKSPTTTWWLVSDTAIPPRVSAPHEIGRLQPVVDFALRWAGWFTAFGALLVGWSLIPPRSAHAFTRQPSEGR